MSSLKPILFGFFTAVIVGAAVATDLTYNPLEPQTGDQEIVIRHKEAVATVQTAKALALASYQHISTTGTTTLAGVTALDRLVISKAGGGDTVIALKDGTAPIANASGAAPASLHYGVALASGTLVVVVTGTAPDVTVAHH